MNQVYLDDKSGLEILEDLESVVVKNHHTGCKAIFDLVTWDLVGKYFGPKAKKEVKPGGKTESK